ncbi:hypothetical protein PY365_16700 [Roseiarcaceae bacterium H3SJ34-1]|uniref:hypothetical protein n=1 Tax=Terripilifer ovatus TaxID=3032367 RepID=UPI003AB96A23|nr:hypothetical protein [Roseiarcaceae bacterium H3SJ34-1]
MVDFKGRAIDDESYTGLIETLGRIRLICHVTDATKADLSKENLIGILSQIGILATESLIHAGATLEEVTEVTHDLLSSDHGA